MAYFGIAGSALADAEDTADRVTGRVVDADTEEPVSGATIRVDLGDPAQGAVELEADERGAFEIGGARPGGELRALAVGYVPEVREFEPGEEMTIELSTEASEPGGEVIDLVDRAADSVDPTAYRLDAETIADIPGAAGDPLRAVQSLPGAARIPYNLGGLVLRGTDPRDTAVYLGDVQVPILFHFGGLTSFYPTGMLDELEIQPAGFGAGYGGSQGGLVRVTPREGRRDGHRAGGSISLLDASAYAEGPAGEGGSWIAGLRRSYIDSILAFVDLGEERFLPRYGDGQVRYARGDPRTGEWTADLFFSEDRVTLREDGLSSSLRLGFVRGAATYRRRAGDYEARGSLWGGADRLRLREEAPGAEASARRIVAPAGARGEIVRDFEGGHVSAGTSVRGTRYGGVRIREDDGVERTRSARAGLDLGLWAEGRYRADEGLFGVTPGVRLDRFGVLGEWRLAPRVTFSHDVHPRLTLRETLGLYHQPPSDLDVTDDEEQDLRSGRAFHFAMGADVRAPGGIDVAITGFSMLGDRQPVAVTPPPSWEAEPAPRSSGGLGPIFQLLMEEQLGSGAFRESVGRARSLGVEVGARGEHGPYRGMLSYTLSRAERTDDPERFAGWRRYELDQTHNLVAMVSRRIDPWQLGIRFRYGTGNPYTPVTRREEGVGPVRGAPFSARLPPHIQLDARVDYRWEPGFGGTMKAFADIQNLTHRRNVEGVRHDAEGEPEYTRGLPILPIVGLEYAPPR